MILSKRAEALLNNPQYGKLVHDPLADVFKWKLSHDKKLTLSFESSLDYFRIPLMDAFCILTNQNESKNLFILEFREVENYLRDTNENPAFLGDTFLIQEEKFQFLKRNLVSVLLRDLKLALDTQSSFASKNRFWLNKFEFFDGVEFVFIKQETLYFYNKRSDSIVSFNISE
jgi:hypothetical protein